MKEGRRRKEERREGRKKEGRRRDVPAPPLPPRLRSGLPASRRPPVDGSPSSAVPSGRPVVPGRPPALLLLRHPPPVPRPAALPSGPAASRIRTTPPPAARKKERKKPYIFMPVHARPGVEGCFHCYPEHMCCLINARAAATRANRRSMKQQMRGQCDQIHFNYARRNTVD